MDKTILHEQAQKAGWLAPQYQTVNAGGPPHSPCFRSTVTVNRQAFTSSEAWSSVKAAEHAAARAALKSLEFPPAVHASVTSPDAGLVKSELQVLCQKLYKTVPLYSVESIPGEGFMATVTVASKTHKGALAKKRKLAEASAARAAILALGGNTPDQRPHTPVSVLSVATIAPAVLSGANGHVAAPQSANSPALVDQAQVSNGTQAVTVVSMDQLDALLHPDAKAALHPAATMAAHLSLHPATLTPANSPYKPAVTAEGTASHLLNKDASLTAQPNPSSSLTAALKTWQAVGLNPAAVSEADLVAAARAVLASYGSSTSVAVPGGTNNGPAAGSTEPVLHDHSGSADVDGPVPAAKVPSASPVKPRSGLPKYVPNPNSTPGAEASLAVEPKHEAGERGSDSAQGQQVQEVGPDGALGTEERKDGIMENKAPEATTVIEVPEQRLSEVNGGDLPVDHEQQVAANGEQKVTALTAVESKDPAGDLASDTCLPAVAPPVLEAAASDPAPPAVAGLEDPESRKRAREEDETGGAAAGSKRSG